MQEVTLPEFKSALESQALQTSIFIDVRTPVEYQSEHINKVKNIPLDQVLNQLDDLKKYKKIYLHCQSGTRCHKAFEQIKKTDIEAGIYVFNGGIEAWKKANYPLVRSRKVLPIMRQVMLAAGGLILSGFVLTLSGYSFGFYLMAFVGLGLFFSGASGWCGMAKILGYMP